MIFMSCALHRSAVCSSLLRFVLLVFTWGAKLVNSSPATLEARIACPEGTPYEGYTMTLELVAYDGYPFIAPVARFLERASIASTRLEDDILYVFGPFSSVTSADLSETNEGRVSRLEKWPCQGKGSVHGTG